MAAKVIMPKQGLQMTEGTINHWLVKEGGRVEKGTPLFEMETDKLTITMDAEEDGTLLKIIRKEGEVVPITETIAVIGTPGEDISSLLPTTASEPESRVFASPRAKMLAEEQGTVLSALSGSGPDGLIIERDVRATPLAKKLAEKAGMDLTGVSGTGARGKITKADVLAAGNEEDTTLPLRGMRKIIAQRMRQSLSENAQACHTIRVDMTNASTLRETYKAHEKKISYNDIILKAVSRALRDFPIMNSSLCGDSILLHGRINLGVAVAVENGLLVPNIKDADTLSLEAISVVSRTLSEKAKGNSLLPDEAANGTFTVSNLGMFGLESFTAVINPPECGILAVGKIEKTPVVIQDEIAIRPVMHMTLSYDHRIVDGAPAAAFLARIRDYLENPCMML